MVCKFSGKNADFFVERGIPARVLWIGARLLESFPALILAYFAIRACFPSKFNVTYGVTDMGVVLF